MNKVCNYINQFFYLENLVINKIKSKNYIYVENNKFDYFIE